MRAFVLVSLILLTACAHQRDSGNQWRMGCINLDGALRSNVDLIDPKLIEHITSSYRDRPFGGRELSAAPTGVFRTPEGSRTLLLFDFPLTSDIQVAYVLEAKNEIVDEFIAIPGAPVDRAAEFDSDCDRWKRIRR